MFAKLVTFFHVSRIFTFLLAFRWAALIPGLLTLGIANQSGQLLSPILVFSVALIANLFISLANRQLNQLVTDHPTFIGIDLLFSSAILAVSGGSHSPYYLYALSPLLAGAFFFQVRGAIAVSLVFTPLYVLANSLGMQISSTIDNVTLMIQFAGLWLFPILFAYPSILLKDINRTQEDLSNARDELAQKHENLATAHRQLEIIHDLTMLLQAAPDLLSVQERVLGAVTTELGFSKSVVALVDPAYEELGGWLVYTAEATVPAAKEIPLKSENGALIKALLNRTIFTSKGEVLICDEELNGWLNEQKWLVMPLYLREHPVGLLLVNETDGFTKEQENTLMTV